MPPREEPKQGGCGGDRIETPTDTAHTPDPYADKLDKMPKGCGHPTKTPEELADEMIMHAWKIGDSAWIGSDGKNREEGDLSGLDPRFKDENHIFDDRPGHLPDNQKNRERIKEVVTDPTKYLGPDKHGNWWFGEILPDGTQIWGQARGEMIMNGGLNEIPQPYNPDSGLCDFDPTKQAK